MGFNRSDIELDGDLTTPLGGRISIAESFVILGKTRSRSMKRWEDDLGLLLPGTMNTVSHGTVGEVAAAYGVSEPFQLVPKFAGRNSVAE